MPKEECDECDGTGTIKFVIDLSPEYSETETTDCEKCNGTGFIPVPNSVDFILD